MPYENHLIAASKFKFECKGGMRAFVTRMLMYWYCAGAFLREKCSRKMEFFRFMISLV